MRIRTWSLWIAFVMAILAAGICLSPTLSRADNKILGRVNFDPAGKAEKSAGVWVDGQYVGHISELKGNKKVLLMPGAHAIAVRQSGYKDWTGDIMVQPGQDVNLSIRLERNPEAKLPTVTAQVKLQVDPDRAAVFVDGHFVGYVHEFGCIGRAMLVAPGKHQIKVALVGYRDFTTELDLQPNQKYTLKTSLIPGSVQQADPSVKRQP